MQTRDPRTATQNYFLSLAPYIEHELHKKQHPVKVIYSEQLSPKRSEHRLVPGRLVQNLCGFICLGSGLL